MSSYKPTSKPPAVRPGSTSPTNSNLLAPTYTTGTDGHSDRSPSVSSTRRISFVDKLPRPPSTQHRLRIPTKKASLASGFDYDPKLNKYSVSEKEWYDFSDAVLSQANLPRSAGWAWSVHKKDVIKKLKNQLQYEASDVKRTINAWNRNFKRKGFTVSMELPGPAKFHENDSEEQKEQARKEARFFRMVVTPVAEKAGSIYSRTSSLTRTVSMEGKSLQPSSTQGDDVEGDGADDQKPEDQTIEDKEAEEKSKEAEKEVAEVGNKEDE